MALFHAVDGSFACVSLPIFKKVKYNIYVNWQFVESNITVSISSVICWFFIELFGASFAD